MKAKKKCQHKSHLVFSIIGTHCLECGKKISREKKEGRAEKK
jgi:hypothetical protein